MKGKRTLLGILMIAILWMGYGWYSSYDYEVVGVPVLNYHQVNDRYHSALTMPVFLFDAQMKYLHNHGYTTITLDDLHKYVTGKGNLPKQPVLITFDDGYVDNYEEAFPILQKYGQQATLFMIGDAIGTTGFVSWSQLKEMEQGGFHIESHTYSHKDLRTLSDEAVERELVQSKDILERGLQKQIQYIAYPQGFTTEQTDALALKAGYALGFTVQPGNVFPGQDPYRLPRQAIFANDIPYYTFLLRLHFPREVQWLWELRDQLLAAGYPTLASLVPLF